MKFNSKIQVMQRIKQKDELGGYCEIWVKDKKRWCNLQFLRYRSNKSRPMKSLYRVVMNVASLQLNDTATAMIDGQAYDIVTQAIKKGRFYIFNVLRSK